jgi:ethanolamine transporter
MVYFSIVVVAIMVVFALGGIIDTAFLKDKWGLGPEFRKGIEIIGPLCLSIVGIIAFVPEIAWVIEHTLSPLYEQMGLDPSMAVTSILAIDMGGYQLALAVAKDQTIGQWAGIVYGSMMGATIVFSIPVGLSAIKSEDVPLFAKGTLFGIAAIPFGTFVGGLMMGIPALIVLKNLIIPCVLSLIIIICLALWPKGTTKVFSWFSKAVTVFGLLALGIAMFNDLVLTPISNTGAFDIKTVPFFRLLDSCSSGIGVAGSVGLVLSGALPFIYCLNKLIKKITSKRTKPLTGTEAGKTGFLLSAANNMAMFSQLANMTDREKILNVAFSVCGAFVIGDHLAFTAGNAPELIAPMMVSKLVGAAFAILFAWFFTRNIKNTVTVNKEQPISNTKIKAESKEEK